MDYVNARIWKGTRRLLRLLAADSGEQMVEILDRLCREEIKKRGLDVAANVAEKQDTASESGDTPRLFPV